MRLLMPSIHVADWTKRLLDEVKDREDHASYDSVIKSWAKEVGAHKPPQRRSGSTSSDIELGRQSISNLPVNVDPFTLAGSYNVIRAGDIGSGKSVSTKVNLYQLQTRYPDLTLVVADPFTSFEGFTQAVGGRQITIGEDMGLNPLEIKPRHGDYQSSVRSAFENKIADVMAFLQTFFDQRNIDISDKRGVLERAIKDAYNSAGITSDPTTFDRESPTLTDVLRTLRQITEHPDDFSFSESGAEVDALEESASHLLIHLRPFMDGGPLHNFSRETEIAIDPTEVTYLDIESHLMGECAPDLTLQALELLTYETAASTPGKFIFAADDAHRLAETPSSGQLLERHFRSARHYDLSIQLTTQTIEHFLQTEAMSSVVDNAGVLMFHKMQALSDEHAKELDMTDAEAEFVRDAKSGKQTDGNYAEALIRVDNADWQPIRVQPTETELAVAEFKPERDDPEDIPL